MRKVDRFQRGQSTFKCMCCKRTTRNTGQGGQDVCEQCYELGGLDNMVNDDGGGLEKVIAERDDLLATIAKRGGDVEAVKRSCEFLWPKKNEKQEAIDFINAKVTEFYDDAPIALDSLSKMDETDLVMLALTMGREI